MTFVIVMMLFFLLFGTACLIGGALEWLHTGRRSAPGAHAAHNVMS